MKPLDLALAALWLYVVLTRVGAGGLLLDLTPGEKLVDKPGLRGLWIQPPSDRPQNVIGAAAFYERFPLTHLTRTTLDAELSDPAIAAWRDKLRDQAPCFSVAMDGYGETIPVSDATTLSEAVAPIDRVEGRR